jgi:curved DNA-binding protein CbpA
MILAVLLLIFLLFVSNVWSYEWEDWGYYQILGLEDDRTANVTAVKQAYRRQAKAWHPDKQAQEVDKEEATARFRKIAEAYQILSDEKERRTYDLYLRQQEEAAQRNRPHDPPAQANDDKTFSWKKFMDPLRVFEDFFSSEEDWHGTPYDNPFVQQESAGVNTVREESWYYDNRYGQVLRVIEKIELANYSYRTLYQDFVEDWDPYRRAWAWYPLQAQPILKEEGRLDGRTVLQEGEVLDPPFILREGPFVTGLYDCNLQVRRGKTVLWRSREDDETDFWGPRQKSCRMTLYGSQLIVENTGSLAWQSPRDEDAWIGSRTVDYQARLDTDGSLTVYRMDPPQKYTLPDFLAPLLHPIMARKNGYCVFSTNLAGCHRLGRWLIRCLTLNRRLDVLFQLVSRAVDLFLDWCMIEE